MVERTGPALTITGTCEGCCHLRTNVRDPRLGARLNAACVHPTRADGGTLFAKSSKAPTMPTDCPDLPAARLALARSICNHCGADIAPDYLGLYAKPTCEKCANERTGDTADECSAACGAGESEARNADGGAWIPGIAETDGVDGGQGA